MSSTPVTRAFERPCDLQATLPAERRGLARDQVRLMVSSDDGIAHHVFEELPGLLAPGDLLVVNRSATLPASLPADGPYGTFTLNLSTRYGDRLWLAEPRWSHAEPGPVPLGVGDRIRADGVDARVAAWHPRLPRLAFVAFESAVESAMARAGVPIRYAYVPEPLPLAAYQTVFADVPGSAEMPSAARPFTPDTLAALDARGVGVARLTLHTGVSSLEVEGDEIALYAEPFAVPAETVAAIEAAREAGGRVIAVGTTVVRALESAWDGRRLRPASGFTRRVIRPGAYAGIADGLLTGLHDAGTSHLAMLAAVAGEQAVRDAYGSAIEHGYLWHEFGDVHLLWGDARRFAVDGMPGSGARVRRGSARAP